ncbi:MAG TPA: GNAT family N-acetyltransferase [Nocardioides sp.]|uniref:GNAT family N-acetyltransferase n=1 Tax=Nocardioides sp. TaxID=35761 RepID=UPI002F3E1FE5
MESRFHRLAPCFRVRPPRLRFREMARSDVGLMTGLPGDPEVMTYYPRPKTRAEALDWILWNRANYAEHGHGLWIVETREGDFVGDCGLTWQPIGEERALEVGYHTMRAHQGRGYASEAAKSCLELATGPIGASHVVAIINPLNVPSPRVAEKLGMAVEHQTRVHGQEVVVYGTHSRLGRQGQ